MVFDHIFLVFPVLGNTCEEPRAHQAGCRTPPSLVDFIIVFLRSDIFFLGPITFNLTALTRSQI